MKNKVIQSEECDPNESRRYNLSTFIYHHQDIEKILPNIVRSAKGF